VQLDGPIGVTGFWPRRELVANHTVRRDRVDPRGNASRDADLDLLVSALEAEDATLCLEHADRAVGGLRRDVAARALDRERARGGNVEFPLDSAEDEAAVRTADTRGPADPADPHVPVGRRQVESAVDLGNVDVTVRGNEREIADAVSAHAAVFSDNASCAELPAQARGSVGDLDLGSRSGRHLDAHVD
jgi:hypothetical protein